MVLEHVILPLLQNRSHVLSRQAAVITMFLSLAYSVNQHQEQISVPVVKVPQVVHLKVPSVDQVHKPVVVLMEVDHALEMAPLAVSTAAAVAAPPRYMVPVAVPRQLKLALNLQAVHLVMAHVPLPALGEHGQLARYHVAVARNPRQAPVV
ncbi:hypothetical protein BH10PAT2_BH10PAT2_2190 [soil metagenome]